MNQFQNIKQTKKDSDKETVDKLLEKAYPNFTYEQRQEARLDLELVSRWLLEQIELGNPAFQQEEPKQQP